MFSFDVSNWIRCVDTKWGFFYHHLISGGLHFGLDSQEDNGI